MPAVDANAVGPRFGFVHASWHPSIVHKARDGFLDAMARLGVARDAIDVLDVPGAFELPLMVRTLARSGRYDAIVACALVVDGGIYRHEFVAQAAVQGLMTVQLDTGVPVLSVVLTPHHFQPIEEHQEFFGAHFVVKGGEAADACVRTVQNLRRAALRATDDPVTDSGGPDTIQ
ncbi:MAG: 6,7-dimethyl-8-ribityllumazine synthase [Betaproteobacteria bacterium]